MVNRAGVGASTVFADRPSIPRHDVITPGKSRHVELMPFGWHADVLILGRVARL